MRFRLPTMTLAWFESWLYGEGRAYGGTLSEDELFAQYAFNALWRDIRSAPTADDGSPVYDDEAWSLDIFTRMLTPAANAAEGGTRAEVRTQTVADAVQAVKAMAEQGIDAMEIARQLPGLLGGS